MTPRVCSSFDSAFGRFTSAAGFTIAEAVIMKMMSSTRKTSVSGVTLISATRWPRRWALSAMGLPCRHERLDHAPAADPQPGVDALHARLEVVVERDRHDADREAERRGDQGLGDAPGDHAEAAGAGDRHAVEGAHDAEHRAEQADERRRRADRRQHPEVGGGALRLLELPLLGDA